MHKLIAIAGCIVTVPLCSIAACQQGIPSNGPTRPIVLQPEQSDTFNVIESLLANQPASNQAAFVSADDPKDLRLMKQTKWIVVSVKRDGETVPAQYGQKVGDVISFRMEKDTGQVIFG